MGKPVSRVVGFAARLRRLRNERGLTQAQLAAAIGRARVSVGYFECEETLPSLDTLCRLADALDVTTDELLGRGTEPAP
jgi:transcriptional regulator with XRE-family HTH domain